MKIQKTTFIMLLLSWLVAPVFAYAHALNPLHYPLGPYSVQLWQDSYIYLAIPLGNIIVIALILWAFFRRAGFIGNLWRAILLYAVAQIVQFGVLILFDVIGLVNAGWTSLLDAVFSLVICMAATLLPVCILGYLLYKKSALCVERMILAVCAATLGGYSAALAITMALLIIQFGPDYL